MNIIKNEIDILMFSETKIDNSFPISPFTVTGHQFFSGLIEQVAGEDCIYLSVDIFFVKQLKLTAMLIVIGFLRR